jgi:hypothetical protein
VIERLDVDLGAFEFRPGILPMIVALVRRMISAGKTRAVSNAQMPRAVSTPPKSQITASIIILTHASNVLETASTTSWRGPASMRQLRYGLANRISESNGGDHP